MRVGRIALLWIAAVALGLLDLAENRRPEPQAAPAEVASSRLVDVDEADVVAIRLVDGPLTVKLARQDGRWEVVAPAAAGVPGDLAAAFATSLFAAVVLAPGTPIAEQATAVGLDERRRIEVEVLDGTSRVFVIGAETPTGTSAYIRDPAGTVRIIGRNALVYRDLLLDAARGPRETEPPIGPVARRH